MIVLNAISLPDLARLSGRPLERLRWVARKAGIVAECRVGTIKLYTVEAAVDIVTRASAVRAYTRRTCRRRDN